MKFNKSGQLVLAVAASVGVAFLLSACATLTVDFVYVTSAKAAGPNSYGEVDVFEVNSESGHMRQIPTSPFPSGGRNPVAEAVSADQTTLYVVNRDDNTIVQFTIGNDGKLYPQNTVNTPGVFPIATAVSGSDLFVADTYQPLPTCSPAAPCPGSIAAFPLSAATKTTPGNAPITGLPLNTCNGPEYIPLTLSGAASTDVVTPTALSSLPKGSNLFVAASDTTAGVGYLFGFTIGSSTCQVNGSAVTIVTLTPISGSPWKAGIQPSAVTQDPSGNFVYVTDMSGNDVLVYSVSSGGGLAPISGSPFPAGNKPTAIVIDATGKYAYVANSLDSNVEGYSITNGALSFLGGSPTPVVQTVDTQPVAIGIDPSKNQYLYTANFLSSTVSGFQITSTSGTLINTQFSPFAASANPTAIASITHGAVAKQ